jgi:tetratricopeptide (TPR) repeat protein
MGAIEQLQRAAAFYARGDLVNALRDAESAVRSEQSNAGALQFVGVLHCQLGKPDSGIPYLRRALALAPNDVNVRINLGQALLTTGSVDEAAKVVEGYTGLPDPQLKQLQANIHKAQGRSGESVATYEQVVAEKPNDFESWNNLGNARFVSGDTGGAIMALERARQLSPDSAVVRINLGRYYGALSRLQESLEAFQEATVVAPNDPAAFLEFGRALHKIDKGAEALPILGRAAQLDKTNPETFVAIGAVFADLEEHKQAEHAFRIAIQVDPAYAAAYFELGVQLERQNRIDELETLLKQAQSHGVQGAQLDYLQAVVLRRSGKLKEAFELARAIPFEAVDEAIRNHFLGQVADQLGDTETAFGAFVTMNQSLRESPLGSLSTGTELVQDIEAAARLTSRAWIDSWPKADPVRDPPAPAFLVGFLRSGTTLLDTILMGHSATQVFEELPMMVRAINAVGGMEAIGNLGPQDVADLRSRYFSELEKITPREPGKLLIDKNPLAILNLPTIHRTFPEAKIIFTLRHPCDVVLSCFMQVFRPTRTMSSFTDFHQTALVYDAVMRYWVQCNELMPLQTHTVRYESMVSDLESEARSLIEFLGLPWEDSLLDHQRTARERGIIRTPSYAQVTEKIYTRAQGRWVRYREYFTTVLPILEPWIERFGYPPATEEAGATS